MYDKIEALLNFLIEGFVKILSKLIPQQLKNRYGSLKDKAKTKKSQLIEKGKGSGSKLIEKALSLPILLKSLVGTSLEKLAQLGAKFGETRKNGIDFNKYFLPLITLITTLGLKAKTWYLSLKPTTVVLSISVASVGVIASINIYKSSQDIIEKTTTVKEIVEKKTPQRLRSSFYKLDERHVLVDGVTMPIYVESTNSSKTMMMDMILETSNRYLKVYLFENDYLVKDRLNSTLEPIIPSMPMNNEGKEIIRAKIISELNKLIREKKIKGHIENIQFHTILAD